MYPSDWGNNNARSHHAVLQHEIDTYKHLPGEHPRLIRILDSDRDEPSLTLEYMPNGSVADYLKNHADTVTDEQRRRWAREATEAMATLHDNSVIHADFNAGELLLDDDFGVRVIDFTGCSLRGAPALMTGCGAVLCPGDWDNDEIGCTVVSDLFSLGSTLYQIATGKQAYEGLYEDAIEERFARGEFPALEGLLFADVIRKCWHCEFHSAREVLQALEAQG